MIWREDGVPRIDGATDFRDSAMLAGMMILFGYERLPYPMLYLNEFNRLVRCPGDDPCDMSKDNSIGLMLAAGKFANTLPFKEAYRPAVERLLQTNLFQNGDPLSPTNRMAINYVWYGKSGTVFEKLWLNLDILLSTTINQWKEPNQLLCVLKVLPDKYLKRYLKLHTDWKRCLRLYWCDPDRQGQDICEHVIQNIESWTNK